MKTIRAAICILGFLSVGSLRGSEEVPAKAFSLVREDFGLTTVTIENDVVSNTDRHYTSGLRVAHLLARSNEPEWLKRLGEKLGSKVLFEDRRFEYAFGQHIYTPEDTSLEVPQPSDRPYAGWLYASTGIVTRRNRTIDQVEVSFGVVGPWALAEETQNLVHRWIGSKESLGWEYQLRNEPTLQLFAQRNYWLVRRKKAGPLVWDVVPHFGAALGNVFVYSNCGLTVSAGSGNEENFGSPRLGLLLPGTGYFAPGNGFSWQVFASLEGGIMGRNLFLDGNTFRGDSPSVDRENYVGEAQIGVQAVFGRNRLSFVQIQRTREFATQEDSESYGALSYSYAF
ncbi:hypothetical protein VDG1235_3983 [Verrucomicrobiia bacterium DG1235]|nr:hypothetical protein VDG1235_3983 [Verrucomicrobiae bacterium DG1235]